MAQNLIEKIVQRYACDLPKNHLVHSGDYVFIEPEYVMTHDNTGAVIPKFEELGMNCIHNPKQVVITLDHDIQNKTENNQSKYKQIETFAKKHGAHFYPAGRGIGHQVMCEEGFVKPGTLVVASDSHSNIYGGLGALGTPVVRTDAAAIWARGRTWWQIPPVVKVIFEGTLQSGVSAKDIIIALCGVFNNDEVLNCAIEFAGEGVDSLSFDERLTIANMTTEWGALAGVFPCDDILKADDDAVYAKILTIDLSTVQPYVCGPDTVKDIHRVFDLSEQNIKINKAYLLSCVNGRLSDFKVAAEVLKGEKIAVGVELYIAAASSKVQQEAEDLGYWNDLIQAGAIALPSGCGPCIGLGIGLLEDGEIGISATNRNFKGRMGSRNSQCYLASPAVVAWSALKGQITYDKLSEKKSNLKFSIVDSGLARMMRSKQEEDQKLIDGFPAYIEGNIILCPSDNLNTDGIYPGKYTYKDGMSLEEQAQVVMENYDKDFRSKAVKGDLLLGAYNFGTGSSREQAATALQAFGIQLVIAASLSATYKRNAFNNGFICIECPALYLYMNKKFNQKNLTIETGLNCKVDFIRSVVECDAKVFDFSPLGEVIQRIILELQ